MKRRQKNQEKIAKKARSKSLKELNNTKRVACEKVTQERRIEVERLRKVKEQERAAKAAEKQRQKVGRDQKKALKVAQNSKRKASKDGLVRAASRAPARTTRSGRNVTLPSKFR